MKILKFLIAITSLVFFSTVESKAQYQHNKYVRTTDNKLSEVGIVTAVTTTDATATHIDSVVIADNTAGILTVEVAGYSAAGDGITGKQIIRYSKKAGVITLGTAANILAIAADTALSGGTFAIAATAGNNVQIKVTGKAAVTVKWKCTTTQAPR